MFDPRKCSIFLLLLWICVTTQATLDSQVYRQIHGWKLTGALIWNDEEIRSPVQCLAACRQTDNCYAVGFSGFYRNCSYYNWFDALVPLQAVAGTDHERVIPVKPIKVLHLRGQADNSLTFNESASLCEEFGGRLATYDELKAVWSLGFHKCRCGWLDDGSAYFPSHSNSSECGSAVQINVCSGGTLYDAYCTTILERVLSLGK